MDQAVGMRFGPNTEQVERLLADCRVLGPSGIERIAWGTEVARVDESEPERLAREAVREHRLEAAWQEAERAIRAMTQGGHSSLAWKAEQEGTRRTAEDAALHAALALVAREVLDHETYRALVKPMSEALPWLLPEEPPDQYRGQPA